MSTPKKCYEEIIGFTRKMTDTEGYEAEYSVSKSGLFVDELQGIVLPHACPSDIWDMLIRARENAWTSLRMDLAMTMTHVKPKRSQSTGDIGAIQIGTTTSSREWAGARLFSNVAGGVMTLRAFTVIPAYTGNMEWSVRDDEQIYEAGIQPVLNRKPVKITLTTPLAWALSGNLYIIYKTQGQVYRNKLICSSCSSVRWCWNIEKPCITQSKEFWTQWVMAGGIDTNDVTALEDTQPISKMQGIVLHAKFACDEERVLCDEDLSDFVNNNTDRAIAYALWYKTGEHFLNEIVGTGEVNRYTLLGHDAIDVNVGFYLERYGKMIEFIGKTLDLSRNDCYECRPVYHMKNSLGVHWT